MKFDENDSIRYLMKEMDPSEELLFEKRMEEDEDLLIEVESLRRVVHRLSDLPEMDPPRHLSRNLVLQASAHLNRRKRRTQAMYLSAAASVLVAFLAGALLFQDSSTTGGFEAVEPSRAKNALPIIKTETQSDSGDLAPWVDHEQDLHFMDRYSADQTESYDSLLHHSYQRLRPVRGATGQQQDRLRGLHLTGQSQ
ncbi:MAG: hypothetical protein WD315_03420 [Balneolaceae bacterium]